ncbi:hypothetical protein LCGC14_2770630 [marine sediment metagenome]|uniref:Uncharacterized protein n=1 Tax=marine sediment metagenome TaxID=412755 RepID=A0A0F9B4Z9_9ZZZZ
MASRAENLNQLNLEIADIHREWCNDGPDCIGEGCELLESLLTVIPFASPPAPDAALRRVLNRLQNAVNRWPGDWSTDHRLAYIWAVVNSGWGDEVYAEMSKTLSADWIKAMREDEGVLEAALSAQPAEHK